MFNMSLRSIVELQRDKQILERYKGVFEALKKTYGRGVGFNRDKIFAKHKVSRKRGRNEHTGYLKEDVELDALQLSMICDNGFSHHGGSAFIADDGYFKVTIYTD